MIEEVALTAHLSGSDAADVFKKKLTGAAVTNTDFHCYPFVGFIHNIDHHLVCDCISIYSLVDFYTGHAYLTDPWGTLQPVTKDGNASAVVDHRRQAVTIEEARIRVCKMISTWIIRRYRLLHPHMLTEKQCLHRVWKPNWVVTGRFRGKDIQLLVDGLTGEYYVVGT